MRGARPRARKKEKKSGDARVIEREGERERERLMPKKEEGLSMYLFFIKKNSSSRGREDLLESPTPIHPSNLHQFYCCCSFHLRPRKGGFLRYVNVCVYVLYIHLSSMHLSYIMYGKRSSRKAISRERERERVCVCVCANEVDLANDILQFCNFFGA